MVKKSKSYLKIKLIFLAICLAAVGYFLSKPNVSDINEKLSQSASEEKPIKLIFVGDIMLNRGVELKIKNAGQGDFTFPFQKIAEKLKTADIVFGNLESVISDKGENAGSIYSFRANPKAIDGLTYAGFNILSVANNHAMDYTREALEDSFLRLKTAGIDYAGGGKNATEAEASLVKEINGTKIAFLAYTNLCPLSWKATAENSGINCLSDDNLENFKQKISETKKLSDIVIVSLHAGDEYTQALSKFQTDFAKGAIDAGADLVVGHHPHVVQKYEIYKNKYIFYSLGNFIFDQNFSEETMRGLIVEVTVKNKKITEVVPIKTKLDDFFQVEIVEADEAITIEKKSETIKEIAVVEKKVEGENTEVFKKTITPEILVSSNKLVQGDTLLITVTGVDDPKEITGQFDSKKISFFEIKNKIFSLVGIDAKKTPGSYSLTVSFSDGTKKEKQIQVASGNFPVTVMAFTPELEKEGYNATSVAETIATNDGVKIYQAMETSFDNPYFSQSFTDPLVEMINVGWFGNIRKSGSVSLQHLGTDLSAYMNTPVYAINDGVVTGVLKELTNYGNTVVIDHGLGIFSLYLHLNKFNVSEGQKVKKDQIIGLSGNTGYSIGPHLHFSIKLNGASVDPLKFIKAAKF
jgi:poly-gamma-glutamate synthesis protein (capsule biosynthesis protein)